MSNPRNHYDILGVTPNAPTEIISAVYRAWMQALRVHPDLGGDPELAKSINAAYDTLKEPKRRRAYDDTLKQRSAAAGDKFRRAPRSQVDAPIAYCNAPGSDWHTGRAVDASILGLKFRTDERLVVGMHLAIAFPGCTSPAVEALVRWLKEVPGNQGPSYEVGVEFFEPLPDIMRRMSRIQA